MKITIFDVEHGFCALAGSGGHTIMFDCGCGPDFRPSVHLSGRGQRVNELVVSHVHQDHLSDFPALMEKRLVDVIHSNPSLPVSEPRPAGLLGSGPGAGVEAFHRFRRTAIPVASNTGEFPDAEIMMFWLRYPTVQNENDLSVVTFLRTSSFGIVFPGDLEAGGWKLLMDDPTFCWCLTQTTFFVASHHGRANGYLPEVFDFCSPELVIVSDAAQKFESQKVDYGCRARGWHVGGELRRVLTTRRDGTITIETCQFGPMVCTERSRRRSLLALLSNSPTAV